MDKHRKDYATKQLARTAAINLCIEIFSRRPTWEDEHKSVQALRDLLQAEKQLTLF